MSYRPHPTKKGFYYVEHRPNGYKGKLERRLVEGIEKAIALNNAIKGRKNAPPSDTHPRIKDVIPQYLVWVERNLSVRTLHNKRTRLVRYIVPYFGQYRVRELTQTILDHYSEQHTRPIYRVDLAHLMALIKWMQKRKLAPLLDFRPESVPCHAQVKTIPAATDLLRMLELLPSETSRVVFTLILFTGLRWSEAAQLEWKNVDTNAGILRIAEVKEAQTDVVPIPPMLMEWFKAHKGEGYVFKGRKPGQPIKRLDRSLNKAAKLAGIEVNPHLLRHASATLLYQATGDIYAVQHHLRHSKVATSQIYTRFSVEQKHRGMDALIQHIMGKASE